MSPVCKEDTYRALELLESYYRQLHNTDDADLKEAIETVIRTFKSELFKTLLEIQEYYEKTLMNKDMSKEEKTIESMKLLDKHCTNSETYETCQKENSYDRAGEPINNVSNGVNRDTHRQVDYEQWKVVNVTLRRSETGFGFTIAGGVDSMHIPHDSGIFVASLIEGGAAMQDGRLQVNDVIMHVNNTNLNEITHEIAVEALRNAGNQIKLKVRRRIEYPQTVKICLYRGKMNLGFSIAGGSDQEHYPGDPSIYITKIIPNGVAELDNRLAVNDCITSVNNIDLTNVTHRESIEALRSSNIDPIILYVKKYSQDGYKNVDDVDDNHIENNVFSNESQNVYSGNDSQIASKYSFNDQNESIEPMQFSDANYDTQQVLSTRSEQYFTKEIENNDSPDKIARSDSITVNMDNDISRSPRKVVLHRKSDEPSLGFNIVGGDNNSGIFISYITVGGLAAQNGGIYKGDTILSVNGTDLTEVNHEQAVLILKNCDGSNIEFILEYSPEELKRYNTSIFENNIFINQNIRLPSTTESIVSSKMIKKQILYVRTQFDYDPSKDSGLPGRGLQFSYGNILKVINSGDEEWWKAKLLFVENEQIGIIPGIKRVIKREKLRLRNVKFNNSTQSNIKTINKKMKRFTLSRSKHKQEESFKENIVDVNVIPILSYEFVQQQKCDYPRPVIILGFMKEILCDDLLVRHPDKFLASIPHTSRPIREGEINGRDYHFVSYENMNQDIKDHKFIEAGEYKSNLYATSLQSIKEVMLMEKHCILDVTGKAISRLKSANIHPIVILVKPSSVKIMIDINKNLTNDQALLIFNKIVKIEQDFNQYFDVKVSGENISEVYDKIYATIINHARSIWVKCDVEN